MATCAREISANWTGNESKTSVFFFAGASEDFSAAGSSEGFAE
jgi:hypothetical protein